MTTFDLQQWCRAGAVGTAVLGLAAAAAVTACGAIMEPTHAPCVQISDYVAPGSTPAGTRLRIDNEQGGGAIAVSVTPARDFNTTRVTIPFGGCGEWSFGPEVDTLSSMVQIQQCVWLGETGKCERAYGQPYGPFRKKVWKGETSYIIVLPCYWRSPAC